MSNNIVIATTGGGQPACASGSHMVNEVAAIVGGVDEDNIRVQALDCLNRVRGELNMHPWRFLKTHINSTALSAGTATYTLPATFKSPSYFRILDSTSK